MQWLSKIFRCSHSRTTFPLTPSRRSAATDQPRRGTYVACLDCGREFDYDWRKMQIGEAV